MQVKVVTTLVPTPDIFYGRIPYLLRHSDSVRQYSHQPSYRQIDNMRVTYRNFAVQYLAWNG